MKLKRPVKILIILLGALLLLVLVVLANISRSRSTVRGIEVDIRYGRTPALVNAQPVKDSILAALPALLQQQVADVDRQAVARAAARVPYLCDVTASLSVSGKVVVRATQRRPIARLFYRNREFYMADDGHLMPSSPLVLGHSDLSLLVTGADPTTAIDTTLGRADSPIAPLFTVARFLDSDSKYGDLIDQVYLQSDGDLIMVPKVGNHTVELGPAENLDAKFANLLAFYRKGMPRAGWDTYSRLSLKYDGQVVCTKRQ